MPDADVFKIIQIDHESFNENQWTKSNNMSDTVTKVVADLNAAILQKSARAIAEVACKYSAADREKVRAQYRSTYSIEPDDHIDKMLKKGDATTIVSNCWDEIPVLRAKHLSKALKGSIDHRALLDLIIMCDREDWNQTIVAFTQQFRKNLPEEIEKALKSTTSYRAFYTTWIKFDRSPRNNINGDALKLKEAFSNKDEQTVFNIMSTTVESEYKAIATQFEKVAGMTMIQAFAALTTGPLYWALHTAHYRNVGMNNGAAFLIHHACTSDKKGDVARMTRLSPLLCDKCLNAKNYYSEFGDMGKDIVNAFGDSVEEVLKVLWRV